MIQDPKPADPIADIMNGMAIEGVDQIEGHNPEVRSKPQPSKTCQFCNSLFSCSSARNLHERRSCRKNPKSAFSIASLAALCRNHSVKTASIAFSPSKLFLQRIVMSITIVESTQIAITI